MIVKRRWQISNLAAVTYNVWNSKKKAKELFDFFDNYGDNGIKINVDSE